MHGRPGNSQLWQAIDAYLRHAYAGAKPPVAVQSRLDVLHASCGDPLKTTAFETTAKGGPGRYSIRLGNRFFPHMKLVVECRAEGGCFFRADAHDAHCRPKEGSCEMKQYQELIERNRAISAAIEREWAEIGLPTFKTFLRHDLERRSAARP